MNNIIFPTTDIVGVKLRTPYNQASMANKVLQYRILTGMENPHMGDTVVVDTAIGMQLGNVVHVDLPDTGKVVGFVVDIVDLKHYDHYQEQAQIRETLREALLKKKQELEDLWTYEMLAEKSPEFNELLKQFKALGGIL